MRPDPCSNLRLGCQAIPSNWIEAVVHIPTITACEKQEGGPWQYDLFGCLQDLPVCASRRLTGFCICWAGVGHPTHAMVKHPASGPAPAPRERQPPILADELN